MQASAADERIEQQVHALNRESEEITQTLPSFGVGGATMREAVAFYNGSLHGFPDVSGFLVPLSEVLRAHPEVRLTQLAWQATDDAKAAPKLRATPMKDPPPVTALQKSAGPSVQPPVSAEDAANPVFSGARYEVALVEGTVRVANNDFRGATATVEALAADLGRVAGFRADVVESPLDTSPAAALQGRQQEREPASMEPRFLLRIVRERGAAG
jgi:hypothetical protein